MAENPFQLKVLIWLLLTVKDFFAGRDDVYVSGDMMVYYEEGNPRAFVAPDVFVTFGIPKLPERRVYLTWLEGPPTVAFEVTAQSSRRTDRREKVDLYARIGIREYFIVDPPEEFRNAEVLGYRLVDGRYQRIEPDEDGLLLSETLGLRLKLGTEVLNLFDVRTGERLLSPMERATQAAEQAAQAREQAAQAREQLAEAQARVEAEARARAALEARIAELEAQRRRENMDTDGGTSE